MEHPYALQPSNYIETVNIYVENLIILANNVDKVNKLKCSMEHKFEISVKCIGPPQKKPWIWNGLIKFENREVLKW